MTHAKTIKLGNGMTLKFNRDGFSLWVKEKDGLKHWLLDGSMIAVDREIRIGKRLYATESVYNSRTRSINIRNK